MKNIYGYIYKIYNDINDKVYIGQVIATRGINQRLKRHFKDAENNSNSKIARAIRKYGKEHFYIIEIDTSSNKQELNEKEKYWIKQYDSIINGYNMTLGGDGGNTYINKTPEELNEIKQKISLKNHLNNGNKGQYIGELNSMYGKHHTKEAKEKISNSLKGKKKPESHGKKVSKALKNKKKDYIPAVVKLYITNIHTQEVERLSAKEIVLKLNLKNYKILKYYVDNQILYNNTYLISKSVSTIPDECKGVGSEISTDSKRTTTEK